MKVMVRAIHMHLDNNNSLITNIQFNRYTACMQTKKIELWCMWGNSCCDFEEGREDMGIDRANLCISWGSVLLFCSDEILNDWTLDEPWLVFIDPLTLYWWLVSSALNTYDPLSQVHTQVKLCEMHEFHLCTSETLLATQDSLVGTRAHAAIPCGSNVSTVVLPVRAYMGFAGRLLKS